MKIYTLFTCDEWKSNDKYDCNLTENDQWEIAIINFVNNET